MKINNALKHHENQIMEPDLKELNKKYRPLRPEERIRELYNDFDNILFTSSFGTTAVYLIDLLHRQGIYQKVHFIDTTFHFKETLEYKQRLKEIYDLDVIDVLPDPEWNKVSHEAELWKFDPDQCCQINKVNPFNAVKLNFDVWISGLMHWQSSHRKKLEIFEGRKEIIRFHPILDISENEALEYIEKHNLPVHPLKPLGYESIGCKHCTLKGKKRKGRWAQTVKTECGLHL